VPALSRELPIAGAAPANRGLRRAAVCLGVVCPMANEGDEAVAFCKDVLDQCRGFKEVLFFAVFDRVTTDSSLDQMRVLEGVEPRLRVIWAPENRSAVDAYQRGYREALNSGCDWILEIDAGYSHLPSDIPQFFDAMEQGMDCVFGSRILGSFGKSPLKRRLISKGGTLLTNAVLGTRQTDMTSGFEMFTRQALQAVLDRGIQSKAHFFQTEIKTYCRKMRIVEVPISYQVASPRLKFAAVKDAFRQLGRLFQLRLKGQI
jgi:dolichol-phosphate mannosyltransferase